MNLKASELRKMARNAHFSRLL